MTARPANAVLPEAAGDLMYIIAASGEWPSPSAGGSYRGMIGEIAMFSTELTPSEWLPCDGRVVAIDDYSDLFSVIGPSYGASGIHDFALPDLRGRSPICVPARGSDDSSGSFATTDVHFCIHAHGALAIPA